MTAFLLLLMVCSGAAVIVGAVASMVSLWRAGTFYIEFDGTDWWVWQRRFGGWDRCCGWFHSEAAALLTLEALKINPPKKVSL